MLPFIPVSTCKILNSLFALECGAVKDESEVLKWEGVKRSVSVWNQDHKYENRNKKLYSMVLPGAGGKNW